MLLLQLIVAVTGCHLWAINIQNYSKYIKWHSGSACVSYHCDMDLILAPWSSLIKVTFVTGEKSVVQFDSTKHCSFPLGVWVSSCSNVGSIRGGPCWSFRENSFGKNDKVIQCILRHFKVIHVGDGRLSRLATNSLSQDDTNLDDVPLPTCTYFQGSNYLVYFNVSLFRIFRSILMFWCRVINQCIFVVNCHFIRILICM